MAYEQILSQYANINNVDTLWKQIVANFVHAAPRAKGDMLYWGEQSNVSGANNPKQPSRLAIGNTGDFLSVNNGVPVWTAFGTPSLAFSGTTTNAPELAITVQGKTSTPVALPVADATHSGILTTGPQPIAGAKTFKETVHSEKDVEADGGVSAYGIADLSMGGGGGTGTVIGITYGDVSLQTTYTPVDGIVTLPKSADNITWTSTNQSLTQTQKTNLLALYAKAPNDLWVGNNELADKNFVNSSIQTATAEPQGNYNAVSDLGLSVATATSTLRTQIATALGTTISSADNNDYCFVEIPTADATPEEIARVERYKYNGTVWSYEYTLNNSGFTAAQWSAINSGITSSLVSDIGTLKSRFTGDAANNALQLEGHSASYFATASALNNYLLLTGGTLDAKDVYPLYLDNTASGATDVGMKLKVGGAAKGALLYGSSSWGTALLNIAAGNYAIGVKDDGTPYFGTSSNKYKLWHENNDGSGSGLDADLLDGQHASYFAVKEDTENAVNTLTSAVGGISAIAYDNKNKIEAVNNDVIEIFGYFDGSSARHALSSDKLSNTSKIGDTNQPVYFTALGVPAAIDYTIGRNVAAGEDVTPYTQGDSIDITNHVVKVSMTATDSPSASGNSISFIDTISQNTAGKISATKKTIYTASSTQLGLVKVGTSLAISDGVLNVGTGGVTNAMLAGSIANDKLVNSKVTIAGTDVSLGGSITAEQLQTNLGLGGAAYKAADYYVSSISWDSTNRKLQQSKGGAASTDIVQFGTAALKAYTDSSSARAISSTGTDLVTERDVYYGLPTINNAHNYTSNSTFYAPTEGGTAGHVLIGDGTTSAPVWTNKIFVDTTNNRVGINTTSPSQTLSVAGTAGITGNTTIGGTLDVTGVATFNSNVRLPYTSTVKIKDSGDTYRDILAFNSNNRLVFGMGTAQAGYDTFIGGKNVVIQTGTTPTTEGTFSTSGLSIVHDITSTTGDIQALAGGVAAYGITDLAMGGGGGTGTVIAIKFEGSSTQYNPVDGIITLPAYPSLIGYATQNWVSSQITALNLGTASTHDHGDYVTAVSISGTNLSVTKGSGSAVTSAINAATLEGTAKSGLFTALTTGTTNAVSMTIGDTTKYITASDLRTSLNIGQHSDYVTALDVSGNTLTWSKGGAAQDPITVPYATKAQKDADGNTISSTYLKLSGGTMSNTNVVTNLNADLLDGQHGSYFATAVSVAALQDTVSAMSISHYSSQNDSVKDCHVVTINGKKLYLKFRATQADATTNPQTLPAFELAVADNAEGQNEQVFAFGTITEDWITTNCVLPS